MPPPTVGIPLLPLGIDDAAPGLDPERCELLLEDELLDEEFELDGEEEPEELEEEFVEGVGIEGCDVD